MLWDHNFFPLILLVLPIYIYSLQSQSLALVIIHVCWFCVSAHFLNSFDILIPLQSMVKRWNTPPPRPSPIYETQLYIHQSSILYYYFLCNFTGYHLLHIIIAIITTFIWFLNYPIWSLSINPIHVVHDSSAFGCYTEMNGNVSGE